MTVDILICTFNKGIVRVGDILLPKNENIRYVVSFQYTDERYTKLIPESLTMRDDVVLSQYKGKGLSANRNHALNLATSDLVVFADDDARFSEKSIEQGVAVFEKNPDVDIAFFQASTYTGRPLKEYPKESYQLKDTRFKISIIEMVARREKTQGVLRFDERFGLGAPFLTCGEEEVWLKDAFDKGLKIFYYPINIVETSMLLQDKLIYINAGVQRSFGAVSYYLYGNKAWWLCLAYAWKAAAARMSHFVPMLKHFYQGISYVRHTK